ncbi:MAG: hypothetical protein ChlgKO_09610 [Chlamydiales bacterium]
MTVWINGKINLTEPLEFIKLDKNVVICGEITSKFDITFKVNNLIVFGKVISEGNILLTSEGDLFTQGTIHAGKNVRLHSKEYLYHGLSEKSIEKIRLLGINIIYNPTGQHVIHFPD